MNFDDMSEYIWVSEISLPNIYIGNKRKLGDFVINADATEQQRNEGMAMAWFPGFICLSDNNARIWPIKSHVPLIRKVSPSRLEW